MYFKLFCKHMNLNLVFCKPKNLFCSEDTVIVFGFLWAFKFFFLIIFGCRSSPAKKKECIFLALSVCYHYQNRGKWILKPSVKLLFQKQN